MKELDLKSKLALHFVPALQNHNYEDIVDAAFGLADAFLERAKFETEPIGLCLQEDIEEDLKNLKKFVKGAYGKSWEDYLVADLLAQDPQASPPECSICHGEGPVECTGEYPLCRNEREEEDFEEELETLGRFVKAAYGETPEEELIEKEKVWRESERRRLWSERGKRAAKRMAATDLEKAEGVKEYIKNVWESPHPPTDLEKAEAHYQSEFVASPPKEL